MPVGREPLGQVPVPALGAADGVRVDAVVDEADPHAGNLAFGPVSVRPDGEYAVRAWRSTRYAATCMDRQWGCYGRGDDPVTARLNQRRRCASRLGRDPLPERGREHRGVRRARPRACSTLAGSHGEVIVVDNGSEDGSARARARGRSDRDRGAAARLRAGLPERASRPRRGDYIVMIDADLTYDFDEIPRFVAELDDGRRARDGQPDGAASSRARCR